MKYKKVYVEMNVTIKPDGYVKPLYMIWDDGRDCRKLEIDRVLEVRRGASLKAGGIGLRYLVRIQGKDKILWYENPAWFVEVPENKYIGMEGS